MNPNSQSKYYPAATSTYTRLARVNFATFIPGVLILLSMFLICCGSPAEASTMTYVVTSTGGSNAVEGTLPWAVFQATYSGADTNNINFDIPGGSEEIEIVLTDTLYVGSPMVIDGTSQSGYSGQPRIRINCNGVASGFDIVPAGAGYPGGGASTIQGFRITNYSSNAITLTQNANGNTIADNQIGFTPLPGGGFTKNTASYPGCRGIGIASNSNTISGNTISGVDNGITLGPATSNTLKDNFIGTDPTGMIKIGNTSDGIFLGAGAQNNFIGPGNVLSGMASSAVELLDPTATGNIIFGNKIGLNAAGTGVIGNDELGVLLANGASNNTVGGSYGGLYAGNVISGNTLGGVVIGTPPFVSVGSNNNRVEGNFIGTDVGQTKTLGTQGAGVTVQTQSTGNTLRRNVIVGQTTQTGQPGHAIVFSDATANAMYGNWIGVTSTGNIIPNKGSGAYLSDASNNIIQPPLANVAPGMERNIFGSNALGPVQEFGTSSNNVFDLSTSASQPVNISTRAFVDVGDKALIGGIIITGNDTKQVVLRAIGPTLADFGLPDVLSDPKLELHDSGGAIIATNDNWMDNSVDDQTILTDRMLAPKDPAESALVANLKPGAYTAVITGVNGATGIALVEAYDLDNGATDSKLANISTARIRPT